MNLTLELSLTNEIVSHIYLHILFSDYSHDKTKQAELLKDKGNVSFKNGNYSESIELYSQSLHLCATAACYGNRSAAYHKLQNFQESLKDAEMSLQTDKQYSKGYFRRAEAHMALENYDQAIADYEYVYDREPENEILSKVMECKKRKKAKALKDDGNANLKAGNLVKSIELYTQSISLHPTSNCYGNRSLAHYKLQNYAQSANDATESLQCDKNYSKGYLRRADAYATLTKFNDAIRDYKTYLTLNPNDIAMYRDLSARIAELQNVVDQGKKCMMKKYESTAIIRFSLLYLFNNFVVFFIEMIRCKNRTREAPQLLK